MAKKSLFEKILKAAKETSRGSSAAKTKIQGSKPKTGGRPCGGCSGN